MIVFFGTYLSKSKGTKGPSEFIANAIQNDQEVFLVSTATHPIIRLYQSLIVAMFRKMEMAILDVYSSRVLYQTVILAAILRIRNIKYISVLHGGGLVDSFPKQRKIITFLLQGSAKILTPSKMLQSFFKAQNFNTDYLPNPIQHQLFPYKQRIELNQSPKLLWIRAFSETYQPTLAIEALYYLHQQHVKATLTMIGPDLGLMQQTKELSKKLGLTAYITFAGQVPHNKLYAYMHESDLLLNTTRYESFGLAVAEAASTGLPCVSTMVGELPNIWTDNETIFFVEATPIGFGNRIKEICSNRELYLTTSLNCYQNALLFAPSNIIASWETLITKLKLN